MVLICVMYSNDYFVRNYPRNYLNDLHRWSKNEDRAFKSLMRSIQWLECVQFRDAIIQLDNRVHIWHKLDVIVRGLLGCIWFPHVHLKDMPSFVHKLLLKKALPAYESLRAIRCSLIDKTATKKSIVDLSQNVKVFLIAHNHWTFESTFSNFVSAVQKLDYFSRVSQLTDNVNNEMEVMFQLGLRGFQFPSNGHIKRYLIKEVETFGGADGLDAYNAFVEENGELPTDDAMASMQFFDCIVEGIF